MKYLPQLTRFIQFINPTVTLGFVLFAASAIGGTWVSYDPVLSWPVSLTILGSIGLFLMITVLPPQWSARGLIIVAGLVALYFVSQYAHFYYPLENGRLARLGRFTGGLMPDLVFYTPHPNAVAGFLEGVFLLNLVLIWQTRGFSRWLWSLSFMIIAYGLLISDSRGAWLAVGIAIGIWILHYFPLRLPQIIGLGIGLIISIVIVGLVTLRLVLWNNSLSFLRSLLATAVTRLEIYINSLFLLGDYPFTGIGPGDTFAMVYSRYQLLIHVPYYYYAHNLYLSITLAQGVIGLIALGVLLIAFYPFVLRVEQEVNAPVKNRFIFRAAWLGVTISLLHGLTDAVQYSGDYWTMPMIFALAGLTVAAGHPLVAEKNQSQIGKPRRYGAWSKGIAVGALILIALLFWRPIAAAWYANLGAVKQTRAELSLSLDETSRKQLLAEAIFYFERALAIYPTQASANRRLGLIALDRGEFERARTYLERAYAKEPYNQITLKALGYARLWSGQIDEAQNLFQQVRFRSQLRGELRHYRRQLAAQGRQNLSDYAGEMANRLAWR